MSLLPEAVRRLPIIGEALSTANLALREVRSGNLLSAANLAWRNARLIEGFLLQRPVHCVVQVSNRCNLSCGFCSFWEHPVERREEMTIADFERVAAELSKAGAMVISIEGGEPLMRSDIAEIVRAFARAHHPILFTNGWFVTDRLARRLWNAGLTAVGVSIDYASAERHDAHRGQMGTFDAALRALDLLRETAPEGRRQVMVMTVLMHDNLDDLEPLLQLSAAHDVFHQVTLISTAGAGRHARAQKAPPPGVGVRLMELKKRYPHLVTYGNYLAAVDRFLSGEVRQPCWAGERFLNIDHLGFVSPCIEKLHLRAGNLRTDSWADVAARLSTFGETKRCTDCYTSCRGFVEEMSGLPRQASYEEFRRFGALVNPKR